MAQAVVRKGYTFGPFLLEVEERRLTREGDLVALTGKAFDTLLALVEGAGSLQRQQNLMDRLWPDVAVEPNSLQYNVSLVRRALSGAEGVEIETVRGQGYRLLAKVRELHGAVAPAAAEAPAAAAAQPQQPRQRVHFCKAHDATRLAYALLGQGRPIVKAASWLSHVELDWGSPVWQHWLDLLGSSRFLIRYDARGNGLSDWQTPSITFEDFVSDLGTVFDATQTERAPVLGISQGAAVAAAYAARNPERVSALILIDGCARGWRVKHNAKLSERIEALMVLMRQGWGGQSPSFRQIFTTSFFPEAPPEQVDWFNELQRQTTSPENAARILSALGDVDVREELTRVRAPTLVLHSRRDDVVPFKDGIELASGIQGARFVPIDSINHLWLAGEPGWERFTREFESFLAEVGA